MAEQASSSTAIVPAVASDGYQLQIKDFNPAGGSNVFSVAVPENLSAQGASVMLRAAILKKTTWKDKDFPTILHAVMYADSYKLDIMAGDVYMAQEGRLSTTADAKVRHAISTGRIEGYEYKVTEGEVVSIPWKTSKESGEYKGPELHATVSVSVRGWKVPVVYETTLSEWFNGTNPNWRSRAKYMLRKNALSKAFNEVAPLGVDSDEIPAV